MMFWKTKASKRGVSFTSFYLKYKIAEHQPVTINNINRVFSLGFFPFGKWWHSKHLSIPRTQRSGLSMGGYICYSRTSKWQHIITRLVLDSVIALLNDKITQIEKLITLVRTHNKCMHRIDMTSCTRVLSISISISAEHSFFGFRILCDDMFCQHSNTHTNSLSLSLVL